MTKFMTVGAPGSGTRWMRKIIRDLFKTEEEYKFKGSKMVTTEHRTYEIPQALSEGFKTIHLIRDGRSQIQSRILGKHGFDVEIIKECNLKIPDEKHINYAMMWNWFVEEGTKGKDHENYIEIKYEDMCLKPTLTINKLKKFLELDYKAEALEKIRREIKPSLGKYNNFTLEELKKINKIMKTNMEKLGYELEE